MTFYIGNIKINSMSGNASFTVGTSKTYDTNYTDNSQGTNMVIGESSKALSQMENKQFIVNESKNEKEDQSKTSSNNNSEEDEDNPALTGIYP